MGTVGDRRPLPGLQGFSVKYYIMCCVRKSFHLGAAVGGYFCGIFLFFYYTVPYSVIQMLAVSRAHGASYQLPFLKDLPEFETFTQPPGFVHVGLGVCLAARWGSGAGGGYASRHGGAGT